MSFLSRELGESESAYLAGILDGEGSICLVRTFTKYKDHKLMNYTPIMVITNSSIDLADYLRNLGFPIYIHRNNGFSTKPIYFAQIMGIKRVNEILPLLLPWLRIKRKRAELMLQFMDMRKASGHYNRHYTEDELGMLEKVNSS